MCLSVFSLRLLGNIASKFAIKMAARAAACSSSALFVESSRRFFCVTAKKKARLCLFFFLWAALLLKQGWKVHQKRKKDDTRWLVYCCFNVIRWLKSICRRIPTDEGQQLVHYRRDLAPAFVSCCMRSAFLAFKRVSFGSRHSWEPSDATCQRDPTRPTRFWQYLKQL